jgi:hypothetical protein
VNPITAQPPTIHHLHGGTPDVRGGPPDVHPSGSVSPSFLIRGGESSGSAAAGAAPASSLRLDRINSADLLRRSRRVYYRFLESCPSAPEPMGVVLLGETRQGRVVFEAPILLPEEQFVPMELLRPRPGRGRNGRSPAGRPLP